MVRPTLRLAGVESDRTRALLDGRVTIEGFDLVIERGSPEAIFSRAFDDAPFDVAELSFSSYAVQAALGTGAYIAIPAFISRSFRHGAIYVRRGGDIHSPADLRGRRVGVPEYQLTAGVWVRDMFERQYGLPTEQVEWVTGGVDQPGRREKLALTLPIGIRVTPAPEDQALGQMLAMGQIDALICPRAPALFAAGRGPLQRLFADPAAASTAYFQQTGLFPIMHLIGLRKAMAQAHPQLPAQLYDAYCAAKQAGLDELSDTTALATMLPWQIEELERTRAIMGEDFWPYGLARNRACIEAFLQAHQRQGLSAQRLTPEDIFHATTLAT